MTELKTVKFLVPLVTDCRRRQTYVRLKKRILSFSIQLEVFVKGKWLPVIRYDTTHGFAHRDIIHFDGSVEKTPLFLHTYNEALTFAEEDLRENWPLYRDRFLKEVK
jgi:hypothetical protein